jgi:hypothetical protein
MGSGEGGFGGLQLLSQIGVSVIGTLKGLFGNMLSNFFFGKRPIRQLSLWTMCPVLLPASSTLQDKEDHGINKKKDRRLEIVKEKWVPSRSASVFFKPSRYSARHRVESQASVVDRIIKDVPPEGGGMGAVAAGETIGVVTSGWPAHFDDPSLEDFLEEVIPSE